MDLQKVGWAGKGWIDLAQDRDRRRALMNAVMNLRGFIKVGKGKGHPCTGTEALYRPYGP